MKSQLVGSFSLLLLACAGLCSALCKGPNGETVEPMAILRDLSGVPISHQPEQLFDKLGFSLKSPQWKQVADILAASGDKDRPKIIANKYSVSDLLAMNEVCQAEFTPEKFKQKIALCDNLSPDKVEKPKNRVVSLLVRLGLYTKGDKSPIETEERRPLEYLFYKNLHDYCKAALDNFHFFLWANIRVDDDELDKKANRLYWRVEAFIKKNRQQYKGKNPRDLAHVKNVMTAYMIDKPAEEVAEIKEVCSELIRQVGFAADREIYNRKPDPIYYDHVFTYCKVILGQE